MPLKLIQQKPPRSGILVILIEQLIFILAWLLLVAKSSPTFYPCPESTGTPDAICALTRVATSLGGNPIYKIGDEYPARSTGASTNLKMSSMISVLLNV